VKQRVENILTAAGIQSNQSTQTKAGWCLRQGLSHIGSLDNGLLLSRISQHGVPTFYLKKEGQCRHGATQDIKDPKSCFQSLCRIIAGQFVSGKSAQAAWKRLLALSAAGENYIMTPERMLEVAKDVESFQKEAGLTKNKARSILDLAQHFCDQKLTEEMLESSSEEEVRMALLQIKGIGPWSCDMFLLFYLERPNILPLGDLGVRKGLAKQFFSHSTICAKKDATKIQKRLELYSPYFSLVSYYMWRVADTPEMVPSDAASLGNSSKGNLDKEQTNEKNGESASETLPSSVDSCDDFVSEIETQTSCVAQPTRIDLSSPRKRTRLPSRSRTVTP